MEVARRSVPLRGEHRRRSLRREHERLDRVGFSDLVENLDFGAFLLFEGQRGRWGFTIDGAYIDLSKEGKGPLYVGYDFKDWGLNFGYRVLDYDIDDGAKSVDVALEGRVLGFEYRF
ncbi:MAG TPA: hypothetical protein VGR31_03095 [Planctomycetota bacterium]|nr:hypothetical protein [Planctomycetota bacterium]